MKDKCADIIRSKYGEGPFAACKDLGESTIDDAYNDCVSDVCYNSTLRCDVFASFARLCQLELPSNYKNNYVYIWVTATYNIVLDFSI